MSTYRRVLIAVLIILATAMQACAQPRVDISSLYTGLTDPECQMVKEDKETGASVRKCPGIDGYSLLIADDDSRVSISVVTPNGQEHPLEYWNVITRAFSQLGAKAEWRVQKRGAMSTPTALIVRVDASEGDPPKKRSYLAVAKLTTEKICVTHKIQPGANANQAARRAADQAVAEPCLASQ